jgi:hypothetical protein
VSTTPAKARSFLAISGLSRDPRHRRKLRTDSETATDLDDVALDLAQRTSILLVALDNLGFNITALVTGLGVGGVAIALATRNILGDLFASLSIVLDKPFVVADFISVGGDSGTVEHVGLKTTRIRSLGDQLLHRGRIRT